MKKKREIFSKENVRLVQDAIKRRFGGMGGIDVKEEGGLFRITEKNPAPKQLHVAAEFSEREENGEKLTGLSFSSELPVMRFGESEILLHDPGAADFSRLLNVGAILKNHDPAMIVGVPVRAWVDDKKRGNLAMRWGTTEIALTARKEALTDKSLRGVSVGYSVREWVYLKNATETYKGISGPAWVAVKWDALEASLTPVPADPSVGLERCVRVIHQEQVVRVITSPSARPSIDGLAQGVFKAKTEGQDMKKIKLLRAWKASDGKSYEAGVELEVDARTFAELTEGDEPQAEAVIEKREVVAPQAGKPAAAPETAEGLDAVAINKLVRESIVAGTRAEQKRASDIRNICKRFEMTDMAEDLIIGGKTVEEAQRSVLDKLAERAKDQTPRQGTIVLTQDARDSFRAAAVDGLMLRSRVIAVEKPAAGADELRGRSLLRIAEECLLRAGIKVPSNVLELAGRALNMRGSETISGTTSDFPLILAATANKSLLAGYEVAPATYQLWARTGSLNDFKAATRLKFADVGKLKLIAEGGKYTETKRTEKKETIQLGTYGRTWTMSRQGIINDDLGAFTNTQFQFGVEARMLPNDLAIAILTANAAMTDGFALFSTQHANYSHETNRRLDTLVHATAALVYLIGVMGEQKQYQHADESATARYLNLRAKVWLVSMSDWLLARQVINASADAGQNNAGVPNPVANLGITVVPEQNIKTGATDYRHYLFADPWLAPVVEVAFLQGNQQPYQEEMDQTDADGRKWLVRLDAGAAAVDSVGAVLETGTD